MEKGNLKEKDIEENIDENQEESTSHFHRICLLGDEGVGKSTLIASYVADDNHPNLKDLNVMKVVPELVIRQRNVQRLADGIIIQDSDDKVEIDDLMETIRDASVIVLMYSVADPRTIENLPRWLELITEAQEDDHKIPIILVGNKLDLVEGVPDTPAVKNPPSEEELKEMKKTFRSFLSENHNINFPDDKESAVDSSNTDSSDTSIIDQAAPAVQKLDVPPPINPENAYRPDELVIDGERPVCLYKSGPDGDWLIDQALIEKMAELDHASSKEKHKHLVQFIKEKVAEGGKGMTKELEQLIHKLENDDMVYSRIIYQKDPEITKTIQTLVLEGLLPLDPTKEFPGQEVATTESTDSGEPQYIPESSKLSEFGEICQPVKRAPGVQDTNFVGSTQNFSFSEEQKKRLLTPISTVDFTSVEKDPVGENYLRSLTNLDGVAQFYESEDAWHRSDPNDLPVVSVLKIPPKKEFQSKEDYLSDVKKSLDIEIKSEFVRNLRDNLVKVLSNNDDELANLNRLPVHLDFLRHVSKILKSGSNDSHDVQQQNGQDRFNSFYPDHHKRVADVYQDFTPPVQKAGSENQEIQSTQRRSFLAPFRTIGPSNQAIEAGENKVTELADANSPELEDEISEDQLGIAESLRNGKGIFSRHGVVEPDPEKGHGGVEIRIAERKSSKSFVVLRNTPAKASYPICTSQTDFVQDPSEIAQSNQYFMNFIMTLLNDYPQIEWHIVCSAKYKLHIEKVFEFTSALIDMPVSPLYNMRKACFHLNSLFAIKRIFKLLDRNHDNHLDDREFEYFLENIMPENSVSSEKLQSYRANLWDGNKNSERPFITPNGITFEGFLYFYHLLITNFFTPNGAESIWYTFKSFGYMTNFKFSPELMCFPTVFPEGTSAELGRRGLFFLSSLFESYDKENKQTLGRKQLDDMFVVTPELNIDLNQMTTPETFLSSESITPKKDPPISKRAFLCFWAVMAWKDAQATMRELFYLGYTSSDPEGKPQYPPDASTAFVFRRAKAEEHARKRRTRKSLKVAVVGDASSGKSTLLSRYGYMFDKEYSADFFGPEDNPTFLLMKKVQNVTDEQVKRDIVLKYDSLCYVYDAINPYAFPRAIENLRKIRKLNKDIPIILIANKTDLLEPQSKNHDDYKASKEDLMKFSISLLNSPSAEFTSLIQSIYNITHSPWKHYRTTWLTWRNAALFSVAATAIGSLGFYYYYYYYHHHQTHPLLPNTS